MTDLTLEPYATRQTWSASRPLEPEEWTALHTEYLADLARACVASGTCVIGHIKLLALFANQEYLRVSVVSAAHPPTVTGAVPAGTADMVITLNVLVYGLTHDRLAQLTSATAVQVAGRWDATVVEE